MLTKEQVVRYAEYISRHIDKTSPAKEIMEKAACAAASADFDRCCDLLLNAKVEDSLPPRIKDAIMKLWEEVFELSSYAPNENTVWEVV